jgi:hypothetical protein
LTRRTVLGAAVVAAAGCTTRHGDRRAGADDPDSRALAAARAAELALLAGTAEGSPAYAAHLAHLHALGGDPAPTPAAGSTAPPATDLRSSVSRLQAAAQTARTGAAAALLASIAASHAVLAEGGR